MGNSWSIPTQPHCTAHPSRFAGARRDRAASSAFASRPRPRRPGGALRQSMYDQRIRHHDGIRAHGSDLPEVADRSWPY
nr:MULTISPECIES: hypothetical protein [unclassified Streptomyces]